MYKQDTTLIQEHADTKFKLQITYFRTQLLKKKVATNQRGKERKKLIEQIKADKIALNGQSFFSLAFMDLD